MSKQLNNGKGFLKEKLGDYQVNPPDKVWDTIASQLGNRGRRNIIIISLSAAASIALAVTLGINFFGPELPEETGSRQVQISEINKEERKDRLEEKVVRTIEELADAPSIIASEESIETGDKSIVPLKEPIETDEESIVSSEEHLQDIAILEDIAIVENTEQMKIPDTQEQEEIVPEKQIVNEEIPEKEVAISDPVPEFKEKQRTDPRWIIGAALSPLYTFRDAEASAMAGASEFESGTVAYAGGVNVSYRTASRLAFETGIFYNKMGISISAPGIQLSNESFNFSPLDQESGQTNITTVTNSVGNIIARSGEVYVNNYKMNAETDENAFIDNTYFNASQADQGIEQHLDYLELPFNLRYTLIDRTFELQLVGGMSTNFLVNNYVTMETAEGATEIGYLTNIRSVNYSGNAGLGMIYHIRDQFSLHLEPRFRYFLNSVNDATLPSTRPYTLGIFTGLSYTF